MSSTSDHLSWGRFPRATPRRVLTPGWTDEVACTSAFEPMLAYGCGRSYGDVCLNNEGTMVVMDRCDRILRFNAETGVVHAEAGCTIATLLSIIVPKGWFVPVTPGTKHVTLGGAVANDVHGKNHHRVGTFGCHVRGFTLRRSTGDDVWCSPSENADLFRATIGGLGLTGIILDVELALIPIVSRRITEESLKAGSLAEVVELTEASDAEWDYTVSWVDVTATGRGLGKGLVLRGRFNDVADGTLSRPAPIPRVRVPFEAPSWLLSKPTIRLFNTAWYAKQLTRFRTRSVDLEPFFYPLDAVGQWNLLYGKRGMLQYQCVIPPHDAVATMERILRTMQAGGISSFLAVVKTFGTIVSPGMLSFPRPGLTLTLDMPNSGPRLFEALDQCDEIVLNAGGRVYAAKDARVRGSMFRAMYPELQSFESFVDPAFSSSFWRRINHTKDTQA